MTMHSLQYQFLLSKGKPIKFEDNTVVLMDRVPIGDGIVTVSFISPAKDRLQGVALSSKGGHIELSNGRRVSKLYIWNEDHLPNSISHQVLCPDGELKVWNIYKSLKDDDRSRADCWTNNAGMVVENISDTSRRYRCSDGIGEFSLKDLDFVLEFRENIEA